MKILRYLAGGSFLLWALFLGLTGYLFYRHPSQEFIEAAARLGAGETYGLLAALTVLYLAGAYQLLRGTGRGIAWLAALFMPLLVFPLVYLTAEITSPYWGRRTQRDQQTQTGAASARGLLLEWSFTIPMVILAGYLLKAVPPVPRPADVNDGLLVLAAFVWIIIFTHELGHALAGAALNFELVSLWVCPLELRRKNGRWQALWNPKVGGHYLGIPRTFENLGRRHVLMIAAGPAMNFVIFALTWVGLRLANGAIDGAAFGILHGVMQFSLITGIVNLVPAKLGPVKTDGRYLWEAFFAPARSRLSLAVLGCLASKTATLRPRDWPAAWVDALRTGLNDPGAAGLLNLWAQDQLLAAPDDLSALATLTDTTLALERLAAKAADAKMAAAFRFHVAWLRCRYDGITEGAAGTIASARQDPHTDAHEILRLEAALAAAAGEPHEAANFLSRAEQSLEKAPATGFNLSDLEDLRVYRASLGV